MTGLPKELISNQRCAHHSSQEQDVKKPHGDSFKKLMHASEETQDEETLKKFSQDELTPLFSLPPFLLQAIKESSCVSTSSISSLSETAEIAALFEKMASTLLIMTSQDTQETTLFLDQDTFSSSAFFGTRITIKEFSTAPKVFNIEIASDPTALNLLTTHKDVLLAAFEGSKFPFTIHRLDTQLHTLEEESRRLAHSKEDENQEQTKE